MSDIKRYETGLNEIDELICLKCNKPLKPGPVNLNYLDSGFPVELPCCEICGMVYVPEELAMGKILHVEKSLEDK